MYLGMVWDLTLLVHIQCTHNLSSVCLQMSRHLLPFKTLCSKWLIKYQGIFHLVWPNEFILCHRNLNLVHFRWTMNKPLHEPLLIFCLQFSDISIKIQSQIKFVNVFCGYFVLALTDCGLVTPYGDRSGSTLAQVTACCLMAPSHYLNQCWLIISKIQLNSSDGNFTRDTSVMND